MFDFQNTNGDARLSDARYTQYHKKGQQTPTLNQISDMLLSHEGQIQAKIDQAREVYETYSKDMASLEQDLVEKRHKEKLSKLKASAAEFLAHQQEAMEMVQKITKGIYKVLENIAEREIEKDPIAFIREESMLQPSGGIKEEGSPEAEGSLEFPIDGDQQLDQYEELKVETFDIGADSNLGNIRQTKKKAAAGNKMYDPELIEELEEVFQSAHD